ncbi:hypothetical protein K0T92_02535 [Paenibacillus oenotherae]|uniref:Uncharacterized protein n=1 Tax=Paenibacillus oenotherae TaxID=1435645 RepID=A0ABS7D352_9BACL|nr:hypothetical protein [Paenibacillus oenotherae]MBW7473618.1 hypothetical protein [Paenibacillus oenotherae]
MNQHFNQLLHTTGDLIRRIRRYDRESINREEIALMDDTYRLIARTAWVKDSDLLRERAIMKLQQMKTRLITMMEDLLYTA